MSVTCTTHAARAKVGNISNKYYKLEHDDYCLAFIETKLLADSETRKCVTLATSSGTAHSNMHY